MPDMPQEGSMNQSIDKAEELTQLEYAATQRQLSAEEQQHLQNLRQQQGKMTLVAEQEAKETYQQETRFDRSQTDEQN